MATYHIKPEYLSAWGDDATEETVVSTQEIIRLSSEWGVSVSQLMDQVDEIPASVMTNEQITLALAEAPNYSDEDAFVSDVLMSAAFLPPDDPDAEPDLSQIDAVRAVWRAAVLPFPAYLDWLGMSAAQLSRRCHINPRTVQHWAAGERTCPVYVRLMIAELAGLIAEV